MSDTLKIGAGYLNYATRDFRKLEAAAHKTLSTCDYDTIVGTGLSGAIVLPRLAEALECSWVIVRKPDDGSHSPWKLEGTGLGRRWLFVDDLIASGKTRNRVREEIDLVSTFHSWETQEVGTYLYGEWEGRDRLELKVTLTDRHHYSF